ncbi:hypothetical protein [Cellulomonas sp. KH9]|uniref:hypothetical protein n=1 Tax=Cellulomonas sp. KH9 TaxID=1855324 RepID=UPI0008F16DEB|nr:hypothetical protein [Cellulomonas sp. KH9]SFK31165.1 hypothetical protein SAMN05216467_2826 [Cellulomonas sp. KH9]
MRSTKFFNVVELQSYTDAQVEFIASVEGDYTDEDRSLASIKADYPEEMAARA